MAGGRGAIAETADDSRDNIPMQKERVVVEEQDGGKYWPIVRE
jgi:hypothetical protein